jgi:hypothetical protein
LELFLNEKVHFIPQDINLSREMVQGFMVAKDAAFRTPTARKEQATRMIGLGMLQLLLDAFQMPAMTTCQFNRSSFIAIIQGPQTNGTIRRSVDERTSSTVRRRHGGSYTRVDYSMI